MSKKNFGFSIALLMPLFISFSLSWPVSATGAQRPSFKGIAPMVLTPAKTADPLAAEQRDAFKAALDACQVVAKEGKAEQVRAKFQNLIADQKDSRLRLEAMSAYARYLQADRDKTYDQEALTLIKAIVAEPGMDARIMDGWLVMKQNIEQRQGLFEAAFETAMLRLSVPGQEAKLICAIQGQAVSFLGSAGRIDDAITLAQEVFEDKSADAAHRLGMSRKMVDFLRRNKNDAPGADAVIAEAMKLPLSPDDLAALQYDAVLHAFHYLKPRNMAVVAERANKTLDNPEIPLPTRARMASFLAGAYASESAAAAKEKGLVVVDRMLEEAGISMDVEVEILMHKQRILEDLERQDEMLAVAQRVFGNDKANQTHRFASGLRLANEAIYSGRALDAEAVLRQMLKWPQLNVDSVTKIVERLGRIQILAGKEDEAIKRYQEAYVALQTPQMSNSVLKLSAAALVEALRFDDAAKLWMDYGNRVEAANVYAHFTSPFGEKAREMRLSILEDEKAPILDRAAVYPNFLTQEPRDVSVAIKYHKLFIENDGRAAATCLANAISKNGSGAGYFGDFSGTVRYFEWLKPLVTPHLDSKIIQLAINAYAGLGRVNDAAALATEASNYTNFIAREKYQMIMTAALLDLPETAFEKNIRECIAATDAKESKALALQPKDRSDALMAVGTTALHANREQIARALAAYNDTLLAPAPCKRYTVTYSTNPVTGLDAWDHLAPKTERQLMDRGYGGSMEFLVTDVATGSRGVGIGADAAKARPPEISFIADVSGLHMRFEAFDDKVKEVKAQLLGAGSYEGYIAPGENQPYICFLVDLQTGAVTLYNTTYNTMHHRRLNTQDTRLWRCEHRFTEKGYITYLFLSWEIYADKLPEKGVVWDFENVLWGRGNNSTWNGLKSIHGRSSWGELSFDITAEGLRDIKRELIFKALVNFKSELRCASSHAGVIDFWQDPVLGDLAFYNSVVKPILEPLNKLVPLATVDMSDADVDRLYNEAVFGWNNIAGIIGDARRKYLAAQMLNE